MGVPSQLYIAVLGAGLWQEYVSAFPTHLDVDIFSFARYIGVTQLVPGSLSEGIVPHTAVYLLCP